MPSSPHTPKRRRPSSGIGIPSTPTSLQSNGYSSVRPSHSRKSSIYSAQSPVTPRPISSHDRSADFGFPNDFEGTVGVGKGLGSLADELAEAWDEDGEVEQGVSEIQVDGGDETYNNQPTSQDQPPPKGHHHIDADFNSTESSILQPQPNGFLSLPKPTPRSKHRRKPTDYSGSDYSSESDYEDTTGIPRSLDIRIFIIENLARQDPTSSSTDPDACKRVADALKDLGSQAGVENGAMRLSTAHTALTSHLTHQTRLLSTLFPPLLQPHPQDPSLLPLLSALIPPPPSPLPLPHLHSLHTSTSDLLNTLSYLSDTLHITHQTSALATRRLKAAREAVAQLRRELEAAEEGRRWIEKGGWDERLEGREAAKVCGEVVGGFEEVCRGWREKLWGVGVGVGVGVEVEVGAG